MLHSLNMALDVLTLSTAEGEHSILFPVGTVMDVGSDAGCDIVIDADQVLPHHCMLHRVSEGHFQITAIATAARFTVNGVVSKDLGVDVPFKFGLGAAIIEVGLTTAPESKPETGSGAGSGDTTPAVTGLTLRGGRRDYLLQPPAVKLRLGGRLGEVLVESAPKREGVSEVVAETPTTTPELVQPKPKIADLAAAGSEEESSSLMMGGLLVCGLMVAAIVLWNHRLDSGLLLVGKVNESALAQAEQVSVAPMPNALMSEESMLKACKSLRLAGMPAYAAQFLLPVAEQGNLDAMHELALSLQESGVCGEEVVFLLQQVAEGGLHSAWLDLVSAIDHEENPQRFSQTSVELLKHAADLGVGSAWFPLGERYELGNGTSPDVTRSLQAFTHAQAFGDVRAAAKLVAKEQALERVQAFLRSWNEVSVASLLEHMSATPARYFQLEYPGMEVLLRAEEEWRASWPLRRVRVAGTPRVEVETFDHIKVAQPYHYELECGARLARGTGTLQCSVQRDTAGAWRVVEATDVIELQDLLPNAELFVAANSLRALKPALSREERIEKVRQEILREMRGLEETVDFKMLLATICRAANEFPEESFWRVHADKLCDRMARVLFSEGRWLEPSWAEQVMLLAARDCISAVLLEGHLLAAGYSLPRDEAKSVERYQKAFELSKRRDARFYYAEALFQGRGVPQDMDKAGGLVLALMSHSKHPLEAYLAAHLLWRKAEVDPALWQDVYDTLSRVADKHAPAKHLAAMVLLNHGNTTKERKTGFAALKVAAEAGVPEAMKNLAKCYQDGVGCEADFQAATLWKQKAAVAGTPRRKHYTEFSDF